MFCNKWIKKNLILGSAVIFGSNLINGCGNIGNVDNLAKALYDHCMKNKDLNINPTTFSKENAKNFAEIFGKMVKLTEYLDLEGSNFVLTKDTNKKKEAMIIGGSITGKLQNDDFITRLSAVITIMKKLAEGTM